MKRRTMDGCDRAGGDGLCGDATAGGDHAFYGGKTLTIVVGYSAGATGRLTVGT